MIQEITEERVEGRGAALTQALFWESFFFVVAAIKSIVLHTQAASLRPPHAVA